MHREQQAWLSEIPHAPVFTPTAAEWADPLAYIRSIQEDGSAAGICLVRAPLPPGVCGGAALALQPGFRFTTRQQQISDVAWNDWDSGVFFQRDKRYNVREYAAMADEFARKRFGGLAGAPPPGFVEVRERAGGGACGAWGRESRDGRSALVAEGCEPGGGGGRPVLSRGAGPAPRFETPAAPGTPSCRAPSWDTPDTGDTPPHPLHHPPSQAEYWRERESGGGALVEYGNDVEGSAFYPDDDLGRSAWNLNVRRGALSAWSSCGRGAPRDRTYLGRFGLWRGVQGQPVACAGRPSIGGAPAALRRARLAESSGSPALPLAPRCAALTGPPPLPCSPLLPFPRPFPPPGAAGAAGVDAALVRPAHPRRLHAHALHRHALFDLCLARGGPLPLLHQLLTPRGRQDLVSVCGGGGGGTEGGRGGGREEERGEGGKGGEGRRSLSALSGRDKSPPSRGFSARGTGAGGPRRRRRRVPLPLLPLTLCLLRPLRTTTTATSRYGVPAHAAADFERVAAERVYHRACERMAARGAGPEEQAGRVEEALMAKTTMFSPRLLREAGVPVYRAVQVCSTGLAVQFGSTVWRYSLAAQFGAAWRCHGRQRCSGFLCLPAWQQRGREGSPAKPLTLSHRLPPHLSSLPPFPSPPSTLHPALLPL